MKNALNTSFLHTLKVIPVLLGFMLLMVQAEDVMAQSRKEKTPTIKVSKKRKQTKPPKAASKPENLRDKHNAPKSSNSKFDTKDNYKRPASKGKSEKSKDKFKSAPSQNTSFGRADASTYAQPSAEEGQGRPRKSLWQRIFRRNSVTEFEGNLVRKEKEPGTVGANYQGNIRSKKIDYDQLSKDQHQYEGNMRRVPQKRYEKQMEYKAQHMFSYQGGKKVYKPRFQDQANKRQSNQLQQAGLYKVKKEKEITYTSYRGSIKVPTLKAHTRHMKKLSKKVHEYDGDIRVRKPGKNMHPSVYYLKSKTKNSYEQKEKYRRWRLIITHIFKRSDQPKKAKEEDRKPRYDKKESEIWYY